eukprot:GGOE01004352.1.p1 GENE.GGOE01004352.1~~GGOE01004352.1.p1  ORF type:complete len:1140 (-),score=324.51 GGOE01004352.1:530-3949(-)
MQYTIPMSSGFPSHPAHLAMPAPMQFSIPAPQGSMPTVGIPNMPMMPMMDGPPLLDGGAMESVSAPPMQPPEIPGAGLHATNYKENTFSVAASQVPREELRIDLHTLVRTLAYEAAMIRLCRDLIIYWFWLILAILCVTCDSDIYNQFMMGNLLASEFVERPFNGQLTLKDVHTSSQMFDWLADVWAPSIFQDNDVFDPMQLENGTVLWLTYNNLTSPLRLDWKGVQMEECGSKYPASEANLLCRTKTVDQNMSAYFNRANLLAYQWGTTAPAYDPASGAYCNVKYDVAHKGKCDEGWSYLRGKCYQYVDTPLTWAAAQQTCTGVSGDLVTVPSDIIQHFIGTLQQTGGAWQRAGKTVYLQAWLGAHLDSQYSLRWQDSSLVSSGYSLLQGSASDTAECLALTEEGTWELLDCATTLGFICERTAPTVAAANVETHCLPSDYAGKVSASRSGTTCVNWQSFSSTSWVGNHNYCRATGMSNTTPWCLVDGVLGTWDYCDVSDPADCSSRCATSILAKDIAALAVHDLPQQGWNNGSTAYVNVSFDVYNWNFRYVGQLRIAFDMQPTGYIMPLGDQWDHTDSALQVQRVSYYWTGLDGFRLACEILFLIITAILLLWVWLKAYHNRGSWKSHFWKFWTIYDWVLMAWIILTLIMRGLMLSAKSTSAGPPYEDPTTTISAAMGVSMLGIVLICFRGLKFLRGPALTRGLYHSLAAALPVVVLYLSVVGLVVLGYTIAGLYYFGWLFPQFYTFGNALVSTMFIGLGDWSLYGPLTSAISDGKTSFFAGFWFWTYILIMCFLLLNMFVAIMVHAFGQEFPSRAPKGSRLMPPGNSPHLRGYWLRPWSWRALNCLTLMEGVPWIEKVKLGLRVEKEANVTISGTQMTFALRLRSRWHRKLLERASMLVLLPPDVVVTYHAAWQSFLQHVSMKENEVLRFEDSDLTALFDEYAITARQRHFVRTYARQLKAGSVPEEEPLLSASVRCGDAVAGCNIEVAQRPEGTLLGITTSNASGMNDKGLLVITITGMPDCNTWRTFSGCAVHPTAYKNLCLNLQPDVYNRDVLNYFNPYLIVRCETLITQAEFGALTNRDIAPAKSLVPHNPDFRASRYYRYLIKRHGRCAVAVRHGAKAVGLILSSDPKTMS